jgi:hypothetical protein
MNCTLCSSDITDYFYTAFNNLGYFDIYCFTCYSSNILDNNEGMVAQGTKAMGNECECGTKNPVGEGHSTWCQRFKKEFI